MESENLIVILIWNQENTNLKKMVPLYRKKRRRQFKLTPGRYGLQLLDPVLWLGLLSEYFMYFIHDEIFWVF